MLVGFLSPVGVFVILVDQHSSFSYCESSTTELLFRNTTTLILLLLLRERELALSFQLRVLWTFWFFRQWWLFWWLWWRKKALRPYRESCIGWVFFHGQVPANRIGILFLLCYIVGLGYALKSRLGRPTIIFWSNDTCFIPEEGCFGSHKINATMTRSRLCLGWLGWQRDGPLAYEELLKPLVQANAFIDCGPIVWPLVQLGKVVVEVRKVWLIDRLNGLRWLLRLQRFSDRVLFGMKKAGVRLKDYDYVGQDYWLTLILWDL